MKTKEDMAFKINGHSITALINSSMNGRVFNSAFFVCHKKGKFISEFQSINSRDELFQLLGGVKVLEKEIIRKVNQIDSANAVSEQRDLPLGKI